MDKLSHIVHLEGWIPIRFYWSDQQPTVDWGYLGRRRLADSFFQQTIDECLQLPFNWLFRHQTPIKILSEISLAKPSLKPTGFIFHESRCGSTLVARMLAALSGSIMISEAPPVDSILRANLRSPEVSDDLRISWLRSIAGVFGQPRLGNEKFFFIKFDAWNVLDLPLIKKAFPDVPWIFIYRDPIEVLVSQFGHRGAHMIPGVIDPGLFGLDPNSALNLSPEDYCARVLASICGAGLQRQRDYGGVLVNYKQLPEVVLSSLLKVFGVECNQAELEEIKVVATHNAKNPTAVFEDDSRQKREKATVKLRAAADKWLYPIYEELEAARKAHAIANN